MSWWIQISRDEFNSEIADRFRYNKPEHGRVMVKHISQEQQSRGGKQTKRVRGRFVKSVERKSA